MSSLLYASPLTFSLGFNWIFLIEILVSGILALFFLFYLNRIVGTVVSYAIRAYTWHKFRAHIEISALQLSLLGGRIFFKGVRYHAQNITLYVQSGHVTWCYWLRLVQEAEVFDNECRSCECDFDAAAGVGISTNGEPLGSVGSEESGKDGSSHTVPDKPIRAKLPCRLSLKLSGVEAFIYNQSPKYDAVMKAMERQANAEDQPNTPESGSSAPDSPRDSSDVDMRDDFHQSGQEANRVETNGTKSSDRNFSRPEIPSFLKLFPVKIECKLAAATIGNENTTNVLTAMVEKSIGTVDAARAGPLDLYKLLFDFDLNSVTVALKPNRDFKRLQQDAAKRVWDRGSSITPTTADGTRTSLSALVTSWNRLRYFLIGRFSSDTSSVRATSPDAVNGDRGEKIGDGVEPTASQWHGLNRYAAEGPLLESEQWRHAEYGKASRLVDIPKVAMRFFWDTPGYVSDEVMDASFITTLADATNINGTRSPEYGLELGVFGGEVVYGPWADRQRNNLQSVFFPAASVDSKPASRLKAGDTRLATVFKIAVTVHEDVTLRIPSREESKDSAWEGHTSGVPLSDESGGRTDGSAGNKERRDKGRTAKESAAATDARPYAWLDVTIKRDSVVNYTMDMYARPEGFINKLDLDVKGVEMSSSVNHGLLWRSGRLTLDADLSYPLSWNSVRSWPFNIVCDDLELFILRDHLFLLIDLVSDWASGDPPDFYTFVPFIYSLNLTFRNFCMYLNVNDGNIINDPASLEKNDFLTLEGLLQATLEIPINRYRPRRNGISFDVLAQHLRMRLLSSTKSTLNTFVDDKQIATLPRLTLQGSFDANQETSSMLTDVLRMDLVGTGLSFMAHGFVVRRLLNLQDNYFGDYVHFKTLEEFQNAGEDTDAVMADMKVPSKPKAANELDVILSVIAEDAILMIPTNLYSGRRCIRAELPRADLDLRVTSYYLDMGLNLSPLSILNGPIADDDDDESTTEADSAQIYLAHLDLKGHRVFGLPPEEPAYVNEWDIDVGMLTGQLSNSFFRDMVAAGRVFTFSFEDGENVLPIAAPASADDVTFVRVKTDIVSLWLHCDRDAIFLETDPITVETSDWASGMFSQRVSMHAPRVILACIDGEKVSRTRGWENRKPAVQTHAFIETGVVLKVASRKRQFATAVKSQQSHLRRSDQRTNRSPFLLRSGVDWSAADREEDYVEPPAMPAPELPAPVNSEDDARARPVSVTSQRQLLGYRERLSSRASSASLSASIISKSRTSLQDHSDATPQAPGHDSVRAFSTVADSSKRPQVGEQRKTISSPKARLPHEQAAPNMAFSSPYARPYFSLEAVRPDESHVPPYVLIADGSGCTINEGVDNFSLSVEPDSEYEQTTIFVDIKPGIRGLVKPQLVRSVAHLMRTMLPSNPQDGMDVLQMTVMESIKGNRANLQRKREILEIQVCLPAASIRVMNDDEQTGAQDQIDVKVIALTSLTRIRNSPSEIGPNQTIALHNTLADLEVALSDCGPSPLSIGPPAVQISVKNILLWSALAQSSAIHTSLEGVDLVISGSQAHFLTSAALRTAALAHDINSLFENLGSDDTWRLQSTIAVLANHGESTGDPPFMTRMMYVLRAYPQHFRNEDSWKILSRLRYIMQSLSPRALAELEEIYIPRAKRQGEELLPGDQNSWASSPIWDIPYVNQTVIFRVISSSKAPIEVGVNNIKPTTTALRVGIVRTAIETEDGTSDVVVEDLALDVETAPPQMPQGLMLVEDNKRSKTLLRLSVSTIAAYIDWSLISVAELVLERSADLEQLVPASATKDKVAEDGDNIDLDRHDFQVVLGTDSASIAIVSSNLRHVSRADELRMSLIGTLKGSESFSEAYSAAISCKALVTELYSTSKCIWTTLLDAPSVYIDHILPLIRDDSSEIHVAVAYKEVSLIILDQVPGILHLVESLIIDETTKIRDLIMLHIGLRGSSPGGNDVSTVDVQSNGQLNRTPRLNIAVLAGAMCLEVSLLQSLKYRLEGKATSVRVASSATQSGVFSIDFDIGSQSHVFVNTSSNESHMSKILDIPPINGHVGLDTGQDATAINAAIRIERVEVSAGSLLEVAGILAQPEVQNVVSAIKAGIADVQNQVAKLEAVDTTIKSADRPDAPRIVFNLQLAAAGIRFSALVSQMKDGSVIAAEFGTGSVYAIVTNQAQSTSRGLSVPNMSAKIQDIGASLVTQGDHENHPCGSMLMELWLDFDGDTTRQLLVRSSQLRVEIHPATAATIVDVINHLQDRIRHLDLSSEVEYLRRIRDERRQTVVQRLSGMPESNTEDATFLPEDILSINIHVELLDIQVRWVIDRTFVPRPNDPPEDLLFSIGSLDLNISGVDQARLGLNDVLLQLVRQDQREANTRGLNSAILPEVEFSVSYRSKDKKRRFAFKASGKPLDVRLESRFLLSVAALQRSINSAVRQFKIGTRTWQSTPTVSGAPRSTMFDTKRLESLIVEAEFAGAIVHLQGMESHIQTNAPGSSPAKPESEVNANHGRFGQYATDGARLKTSLTSPGVAFKLEFRADGQRPSFHAEVRVEASSNMLLPDVVPLVLEISDGVKELVQGPEVSDEMSEEGDGHTGGISTLTQSFFEEDSIIIANPAKIFGHTRVDIGIRICRQEFGLSCQPVARVDAKASLEDFYFVVNTIDSDEQGHFFATSAIMTKLTAQVKHMYSREPTFIYDMESIELSVMNDKHLSGTPGISAILNINPTRIFVNGKQLQDLLLFREIWVPAEIRETMGAVPKPDPLSVSKTEEYFAQKYQSMAAAAAFPWNATICIKRLALDLDLGQSIGKPSFVVQNLWASQQKSSSWEQSLSIGLDEMTMSGSGRMSAFVSLEKLGVRTSIQWPDDPDDIENHKTPLIQASFGFQRLRAKAAFDYQAFAFGDIEGFDFLMYNVQEPQEGRRDRLVAVLDCAKAYVFCTATSSAQAVGVYQAFDRLIHEKQAAFEQSLRDILKHNPRDAGGEKAGSSAATPVAVPQDISRERRTKKKSAIMLHTDVVVTVGAISFGVYPSTFFDSQMLKLEANDIQARFAAGLERGRVTSGLGMTLGQLQVGLSPVRKISVTSRPLDLAVETVISNGINAKGGTILRVPKVTASMQTWQAPGSNNVDYVFRSLFEGKIDVGWNLARINLIKGMWTTHTRALGSRLGKALPESAVRIIAGPHGSDPASSAETDDSSGRAQDKITAEIKLPQSRYNYNALAPPIIETPQLRDMGEATPPLEWIGLQRERLPHVTHQVIIVSLLEVCKEVEDAYESILGSS